MHNVTGAYESNIFKDGKHWNTLLWFNVCNFILLGIYLAKKIAKEKNIEEEIIENYAFVAIISGLIGGRLYYVLFNLENYIGKPLEILAVWHGGMAIHGGIIGEF